MEHNIRSIYNNIKNFYRADLKHILIDKNKNNFLPKEAIIIDPNSIKVHVYLKDSKADTILFFDNNVFISSLTNKNVDELFISLVKENIIV